MQSNEKNLLFLWQNNDEIAVERDIRCQNHLKKKKLDFAAA